MLLISHHMTAYQKNVTWPSLPVTCLRGPTRMFNLRLCGLLRRNHYHWAASRNSHPFKKRVTKKSPNRFKASVSTSIAVTRSPPYTLTSNRPSGLTSRKQIHCTLQISCNPCCYRKWSRLNRPRNKQVCFSKFKFPPQINVAVKLYRQLHLL